MNLPQHDNSDPTFALRQQIDALAMALMFQDNDSGASQSEESLITTLSGICDQAEAAGVESVARIASQIKVELRGKGSRPAGREHLRASMQTAITQLQDALELTEPAPDRASVGEPSSQSVALPPNFDLELFGDFLMESREHLSNIETQLLALEQDPNNHDAVHTIFRGFHTIKGLAGFLEFAAIQGVAHEVETALDLARNDKLAITPSVIDVVLAATDYLKTELQNSETAVRSGSALQSASCADLLRRIQALVSDDSAAMAPVPVPEPARSMEAPSPAAVPSPAPAPSAAPAEGKKQTGSESRAVKVDTAKLDFLVDMVGEMVIAQSLLRHDTTLINPRVQRNLVQLSRITGEVQKTAMSMRMVPIGQLFSRMARLVRDLSRKEGKQAELIVQGEDTELDRTIVEDLADPLMHMVRNSADHGIEPVEDRLKAGKNPTGRISLKAYHQAGFITIEVSDDGRGLDREKILNKARKNGLVVAEDPTDREVFNLIFEPGFSTAEQVTDISGRGVGMDVVRKQVQKMRGRIDIQSQIGLGTTFFIKLPLTLAIIDGFVVGVGTERYVVPIFAVREMFRAAAENIKTVHGRAEMVLVRGSLLPIVRLHERFDIEPKSTDVCQGLLIIAETSGRAFCLLVDEFIGKQEVVIKALGDRFKDVSGVAGGAILGDGRVGLILDMDALAGEKTHA
ncbi:MAG TPA: chemotaxis protein CheA [Bryobacteraceae bacterium]|nr:chemotaxis protein CheA [Bryobacteraceae bacterium]